MFEFKINLFYLLIGIITSIGVTWILNIRKKKPKLVVINADDNNWISIQNNPIDSTIKANTHGFLSQDILVTDGISVETIQILRYNPKGEVIFSFDHSNLVTHWRPLPVPPSKCKEGMKNDY